jgi:hypothetical protein
MKQLLFMLAFTVGMTACQKEAVTPNTDANSTKNVTTIPLTDQTLLLTGTFTSGAHTTTGTVKVYEDKDKNRSLVFENFKTDAGPDLRLYMAEDKAITNFIQITDKVTTSGNYTIAIPANVDLKKQTTVAIWCKSFSVLFGSATLK